jgi:two-component system sensor histidine kinase DesK
MTASIAFAQDPPLRRRAWWLLLAIHVPFIAFTTAQGGLRLAYPPPFELNWGALFLALLAGALQLRHSLAVAEGVRPRYWIWSLLLLALIAWLPMATLTDQWVTIHWFLVASIAMLLPPRIALPAILVNALINGILFARIGTVPEFRIGFFAWNFIYWQALQFLGGAGLYGATRLVRLMDQLRDARAELAELAIGRERLRISRDLHDLLGQSLSAVSLKGDLAIGLLRRNELPGAVGEIESLVSVARSTLHDLRHITHREPPIALASEIERAMELLSSTGTETRVEMQARDLPPAIDELFAWALREGVTNVLRHSAATRCSIRIERNDGVVRLEIVNDGALPATPGGTGLSGLAARTSVLAGSASARAIADGRFRLRVEVPERVA